MDNRRLKYLVFAVSLAPLVSIPVDVVRDALTRNPVEAAINRLGFWALIFTCAALAPTAIKIASGWKRPLQVRRMLGLFAFFYALVHGLTYFTIDQALDLDEIWKDVTKRNFIAVGFLALLLLLPLAVTSTNGWVRRLGFSTWKRLHRLSYVVAALGVLHYALRVKADYAVPTLFAFVVAILLGIRIVDAVRARDAPSSS